MLFRLCYTTTLTTRRPCCKILCSNLKDNITAENSANILCETRWMKGIAGTHFAVDAVRKQSLGVFTFHRYYWLAVKHFMYTACMILEFLRIKSSTPRSLETLGIFFLNSRIRYAHIYVLAAKVVQIRSL